MRRHHVGGRRSACARVRGGGRRYLQRRRVQSDRDVCRVPTTPAVLRGYCRELRYHLRVCRRRDGGRQRGLEPHRFHLSIGRAERRFEQRSLLCFRRDDRPNRSNAGHDDDNAAAIAASAVFVGRRGWRRRRGIIISIVLVIVVLLVGVAAYLYGRRRRCGRHEGRARNEGIVVHEGRWPPAPTAGGQRAGALGETDVLGPLSGVLAALPAVAPPPLSMCLMPFAHALAELGLAVRQVRFNKEAATLLQRRGIEIAQKLQDVVKATQGLPTGQVEAVARTVTAIGQALDEAAKFLQQFSKKGAFSKLCSGSLDARRFGLLDKRLCELSTELGSALDLQQLALQAQRFEKIEGLIQLIGQQTIDANNQAAAQRAAILCGIEKGSAVEHEELSALGLKLDRIAEDVSTVIDQNTKQQESLDEVKEMVAAKNSKLRGRALARQDKDRALEELEIELESEEAEPFAQGAQGAVYKALYQGDVVALKKMSLLWNHGDEAEQDDEGVRDGIGHHGEASESAHRTGVWGGHAMDSSLPGPRPRVLRGRNAAGGARSRGLRDGRRRSATAALALGRGLGHELLVFKGVEHRDLKTLNVLLDGSRRCKVTDFGLSKSESLNTAATQSTMGGGGAKGTPAYMAPELLQSNTFTEKTDVYAYGMIVFEVLAGDTPWSGLNQMQIMMQVCIQKDRPKIDGGAPADLVALMQRCWDHEPDARPTFAAIKAELRGGPDLRGDPPRPSLSGWVPVRTQLRNLQPARGASRGRPAAAASPKDAACTHINDAP